MTWYRPSSRSRTTTRGPSSCSARSSSSAEDGSTKPPITCPPSNPTSTRTRSFSANRNHLRENAVNRLGVHECDLQPEHAPPRLRVDQLDTLFRELGECRRDIVHLVGDVVHARPALGEEPPDRRVVAERREQLDPASAEAQRRRLDALVLDPFPVLEAAAEQPLVRIHGGVEVLDGD